MKYLVTLNDSEEIVEVEATHFRIGEVGTLEFEEKYPSSYTDSKGVTKEYDSYRVFTAFAPSVWSYVEEVSSEDRIEGCGCA